MKFEEKPQRQELMMCGNVINLQISGMKNFSKDERTFFLRALKLKLIVLNSEEFRDAFLSLDADETNGLDQYEIYQMLCNGKDKFSDQVDNDLDIVWELYGSPWKKKRTIGYTMSNSIKVFTNRYFVRKWMSQKHGSAKFAGHIFHETLHNMGFSHRRRKKKSLVYKAGYLVRNLAIEHLKGQILTPVQKL